LYFGLIYTYMVHLKLYEEYKSSQSADFRFSVNDKGLNDYRFTIDGVEMFCYIYANPWEKNYYDIDFGLSGVNDPKHRVGKTLSFMNSVLKTVAECMIDFIKRTDVVRVMAYKAEPLREKVYNRFFNNHNYFSQFKKSTVGDWNKIHINELHIS